MTAVHGGRSGRITTGMRAEVGHRVADLSRPGIASRRDLLRWLDGLDHDRFVRVARMVLAPRAPVRHIPAPALGETVADAIDLYGALGVRHG